MRSITAITSPPPLVDLTDLAAARTELGITDASQDARLQQLIGRATAAAKTFMARDLAYAGLSQTFRPERGDSRDQAPESLLLSRWPVEVVTAVSVDGVDLDSGDYELDAVAGLLWRLDGNGNVCRWLFSASCVVAFTGGYRMPGDGQRNLPADIEAGALALVRGQHFATSRDPALKEVDIPGIMKETYWVGGEGTKSGLPAAVEAFWSPYRRPI